MVAGRKAFRGESITALLFKIITEEPPPLPRARPEGAGARCSGSSRRRSRRRPTRATRRAARWPSDLLALTRAGLRADAARRRDAPTARRARRWRRPMVTTPRRRRRRSPRRRPWPAGRRHPTLAADGPDARAAPVRSLLRRCPAPQPATARPPCGSAACCARSPARAWASSSASGSSACCSWALSASAATCSTPGGTRARARSPTPVADVATPTPAPTSAAAEPTPGRPRRRRPRACPSPTAAPTRRRRTRTARASAPPARERAAGHAAAAGAAGRQRRRGQRARAGAGDRPMSSLDELPPQGPDGRERRRRRRAARTGARAARGPAPRASVTPRDRRFPATSPRPSGRRWRRSPGSCTRRTRTSKANGRYGTLQELSQAACCAWTSRSQNGVFERKGYRFQLKGGPQEFRVDATPLSAGPRPFYVDDNGYVILDE